MLGAGTQILTHGEHANICLTEIVHGLEDLVLRLAKAKHDTALGHHLLAARLREVTGTPEEIERETVLRTGADHRGEALHGLKVVVEDMGGRIDDNAEGIILAVEIRGQDLDDDRGIHVADRLDGAGEMLRPAVGNVVAGDGGDHDMLELHPSHGLGDALGLVMLERERLCRVDGTESAGAGAAISGDH